MTYYVRNIYLAIFTGVRYKYEEFGEHLTNKNYQ